MNEWLKQFVEQVKNLWAKWTMTQKLILGGVILVIIVGIILLVAVNSTPSMVALLGTPVTDPNKLSQITTILDQEIPGKYKVSADNRIMVTDEKMAKRIRTILIREDLMPDKIDPWQIFDMERWTLTDFERKVNLRRAITSNIEQHLLSIDDIDAASVVVDLPEDKFFAEDTKPYTASVQITPKPGSDILENRKKIEGVEKLVILAISGLKHENIVITDQHGNILNDFEGMDSLDKLTLVKKQIDQKSKLERQYKQDIMNGLSIIFSESRIAIPKLEINLDMAQEQSKTKEYFPFTRKADNPDTPYDDSDLVDSVMISSQKTLESFNGTGFNPEGPPGAEGQTPPEYKDLSNLVGNYKKESNTQNMAINERNVDRTERPWEIMRVTVGIAIDGTYEIQYDKNGKVLFENNNFKVKRNYTPVKPEDIKRAENIIKAAIGYDRARGDSVSVENIQFDRNSQFTKEDSIYRNQQQFQETLFWILIGIVAIVAAALLFRVLSKYLERKKREKEEELARQHQAMREAALRSAEEQGIDVEMSVEERARFEMQETAVNMAREHPEDVAQLIRTWLLEE